MGEARRISRSPGAVPTRPIVEFKLAKNTQLKRNLEHQVEIYKKASDAKRGIKVIVFFSAAERKRVTAILKELNLADDRDIVLVDARKDNKPSGSKAQVERDSLEHGVPELKRRVQESDANN